LKSFPSDIELVNLLQKGDIEAFDLIYEKYSAKLYLFSLKYLRSKEDAEELIQSVFLTLWENHKKLKKESSFKSFLFTIAYNKICNIFKERNYSRNYIVELTERTQASTDMEDNIFYKSALDQIKKIIEFLPDKQRAIFIKSRFEHKSSKEIADELGLSPATIDNYISECLRFIRKRCNIENIMLFLVLNLFFL